MTETKKVDNMPVDSGARHALLVAAGILLSRIVGLLRQRVFAHYFGNSLAAAAFSAALRIPNYLQNLFGEGVLSASFIPVYAQLIGRNERQQADKLASAVFGILSLLTTVLVALGMTLTPWIVAALAPGMTTEGKALTTTLVQIIFPGTGVLVLSAWCLGILNSHRKFFLSYAAPVLWNGAIILALFFFGGRTSQESLAVYVAWGVVAGSLLQFLVQLPEVMRLLQSFRPSLDLGLGPVREVIRSFFPVVVGRGVVQLSAYVDLIYASFISERAIAALTYAQTIYLVPFSLFGMSVSAAELPAMAQDSDKPARQLRERIANSLSRVAFFVVPSAMAFFLLGDVVAAALLQTGKFTSSDTRYVWLLLAGATLGLLASTLGRLYSSAFYALKDTKTPLRFAVVRVGLGALLAWWAVKKSAGVFGFPVEWGAVGITAASGIAAWVEYAFLKTTLVRKIGPMGVPWKRLLTLWAMAFVAAMVGLAVKAGLGAYFGTESTNSLWVLLSPPAIHPVWTAAAVLLPFGGVYFLLTALLGVPQARSILGRFLPWFR